MGGEILIFGIISMMTWLIPLFGLPIPLIGLVWGIVILRKKPPRVWLARSGIILCSIGLALSSFYTTIDFINSTDSQNVSTPTDYEYIPPPPVEPGSIEWQADGRVQEGEYKNSNTINETVSIFWTSDGQYIYVGLQIMTDGWVAFSIQPDPQNYQNADIILGYNTGADSEVFDLFNFSDDNPDAKARDVIMGGFNSILEYGIDEILIDDNDTETVNLTALEFKREYATGDAYDQPLQSGPNVIVWSFGTDDNWYSASADRGFWIIDLE